MKKHLPNIFTCLNLMAGCIAVVLVFRNHMEWAAYVVFVAAFFDLLDGMAARILSLHSSFGKELDSLADMVTFGFVPGAILFKLFQQSDFSSYDIPEMYLRAGQFLPFIVTVFSALRLAKFNLDSRQSNSFIGLPTPANTLLIVSLPMIILQHPGKMEGILLNASFLLGIVALLSFLLVSEISFMSLKFKNLSFRDNKFQYALILAAVVLLPLFQWIAIPILFFLYFVLSLAVVVFAPGTDKVK